MNILYIYGNTVLTPIYNHCLMLFSKTGYFPETWSEGYIIPLIRKESIHNPENYRGNTLLSVLGKLFTRILNNRLTSWAERYNLYIEAQAGFRSGIMSTTDNIFVVHGIITRMINQGKNYIVDLKISAKLMVILNAKVCGLNL